ncbi:uncharacterized protein TM35_000471430, partial [Trypanosoma theileri]
VEHCPGERGSPDNGKQCQRTTELPSGTGDCPNGNLEKGKNCTKILVPAADVSAQVHVIDNEKQCDTPGRQGVKKPCEAPVEAEVLTQEEIDGSETCPHDNKEKCPKSTTTTTIARAGGSGSEGAKGQQPKRGPAEAE